MLDHAPGKSCSPWRGTYRGPGFLARCVVHGATHKAALEELQPVGRTHIGEVCEGLYIVGPHVGTGEQHEEEGMAETKRYELTTTPIPHRPALLGEEEVVFSGAQVVFSSVIPVGGKHEESNKKRQNINTWLQAWCERHNFGFFEHRKVYMTPGLLETDGQSWQTGEVPAGWRLANETPIHKKGWKDDPGNSRPVSLTLVPGKVMEQIILSAIMWRMKDAQVIRPSQQGFMKGRSCLTNLISFYDKVTRLVDEGKAVDVVYQDCSNTRLLIQCPTVDQPYSFQDLLVYLGAMFLILTISIQLSSSMLSCLTIFVSRRNSAQFPKCTINDLLRTRVANPQMSRRIERRAEILGVCAKT
ncbi:rna-directed dna polymerase from mobile element jockey-like [Limosa lapponica baueri]|uniref:Rna-directed dna polymerase from mobile element jockey-like n=1 Tax=Limosa lapponica baueri TaxID=1758121 RepID=A0A2I0UE30_LIMLA|nr:rna-directed dna polymerase from mobile element jockey-like [Limosa lapponica baueri]